METLLHAYSRILRLAQRELTLLNLKPKCFVFINSCLRETLKEMSQYVEKSPKGGRGVSAKTEKRPKGTTSKN